MGIKTDHLKNLCIAKGLNFVGGRGNPRAPIWIIGEAPGADEDQAGVPFVGYSGRQLDGQIAEAGLRSEDVYFTNPYKVRPPGNDLKCIGVLGIPDQVFLDAFWEELDEFKPTFVVAAGATPLSILCPFTVSKKDGSPRISSWRGSLLRSDKLGWDHYVIPMYHPAFILREYSERTIAVFCLERVREEFDYWRQNGRLQPLPQRSLIDAPSFDDAVAYLNDCLSSPNPISHDIENPYYKKIQLPYTMNFSTSPKSAIAFSLWDWPLRELEIIWKLIDKVLSTKVLIGQNYINFDAAYQEESCGLRPNIGQLHDTMTRHKVLWPEFKHALEFQTIQYTREPYYEIFEAQEQELIDRGLWKLYNEVEMPGARNFHCIQNRGLAVDTAKLAQLKKRIINALDGICKDAATFINRPVFFDGETAKEFQRFVKANSNGRVKRQSDVEVFNLGSPKQVLEEFERLKIWLPYNNSTGGRSTDEEAMQKSFAKSGHKLPKLILESRGLNKLKGTNIDAVLRDGNLFTNYITTGTVNGRRSSSMLWEDTPFAYGANTQNLPKHGKGIIGDFQKEYRECLVARPKKIFLACDQVQAEDWIVQGIIKDQGGSPQGFQELLDRIDRHRKLATVIFKKSWEQCGKDSHERFLGKKTRHAGNYDMGGFRFAVILAKEGFHVPETYCDMLLQDFHVYDPGIRNVFHRYVQQCLENHRTLVNPFGRTRVFFGLNPSRDNTKIFKEAYSTLPQSTVSDNTLQAVNVVEEQNPGIIIKEDHDALTTEIDDNIDCISSTIDLLEFAFDRPITLEKGLTFKIPIEFEMGYNLAPFKTKLPDGSIKITPGGMEAVTKENFIEIREKILCQKNQKLENLLHLQEQI
jgi:uracil-DNA glycosylase